MSTNKEQNTSEVVSRGVDPKLLTEALMSEMRKMFKMEMEQIHERRKGRIQPREVRVEDDEYFGDIFEDDDDWDSMAANRRYDGRFRKGRNREDNNMVYMAVNIKRQFKRRGSLRPSQNPNTSSWKPNIWKEEEKQAMTKPKTKQKQETSSKIGMGDVFKSANDCTFVQRGIFKY